MNIQDLIKEKYSKNTIHENMRGIQIHQNYNQQIIRLLLTGICNYFCYTTRFHLNVNDAN